MASLLYQQQSFLGGLAARYDLLRPSPSTYPLLINGRVRDNAVTAVNSPLQDTTLPDGNYQSCTAVGSILVVFISGQAWYRDTAVDGSAWQVAAGVVLDPTAPVVDVVSIPASTVNYKRSGTIEDVKFNNSKARTTEEGLLATDGITQPALIYPQVGGTLAGRPTFTYAEWTETPDGSLREYVPVGRFPVFAGQKLYMAIKSTGGKLNRIAQSVSGRPLDFVVAIDNTTGDKDGDALYTSHAIGLDEISGQYSTSFPDGSFIASTPNNTTLVSPVTSAGSFFGEPFFRNTPLFNTGAINNISAVDLNGDAAFITPTGIHSFDATAQQRVESNNDPIAVQIHRLLADVQTFGATGDFRDYAYFAVDTIFGPGVAVYDKAPIENSGKLGRFIGLDLYAGIGQIKQYARTTATTGDRLWFITADNRLFEFGAASSRETCRFYIGDWSSGSGTTSQNLRRALAVFSNVIEDTTVQVTQYCDRQLVNKVSYDMPAAGESDAPVIPLPFKIVDKSATGMIQFEPSDGRLGFSVGAMFEWASAAKLVYAELEADADTKNPGTLSQLYQNSIVAGPAITKFAFVGDCDPGALVNTLVKLPLDTAVIAMGDLFYGADHAADYAAYAGTLQILQAQGRLYSVAGNHDLDIDGGYVFNNTFGQGRRYAKYSVGDADLFFYNTGWTTANLGAANPPLEPDGVGAGSVQANWLRTGLQNSTARFKFVIIHEPPYSSSNYAPGYSILRLPFKAWGATAVFSGHDHNYQRHIEDGLNYFICGTGGHSLRGINATKTAGYQNGLDTSYGYLSVVLDRYNCTTGFVPLNATAQFDRFSIPV